MLSHLRPSKLERWYSRYLNNTRYDLSSSSAPALSIGDLLELGGPNARAEFVALGLDYGPPQGTLRLRAAIAAQYASIGIDDVQVTTGAAEAIFLLLNTLIRAGDTLIMQFPIYPPIAALAQTLHARVRRWPLGANAEVDLDHLAALLAEGNVRAIVVNHPHSPTGALLSAGELTAIAALAADFGATLIVDEVHRGIQFAGEVLPPAADFGAHVVSIGDLAKPYGLGGIRIGWLATSNAALRARCAQLRDYTSLSSSVPGEFLGALAVEHRAAILERHLDTARANRASFAAAMDGKTWMAWRLADGGFTIFPRSTLPQPTLALCQALFDRYGVLLLPGEVFDCPGYLRLGFGVVSTDFEAGLERLLAYIQSVE